MIPALFTYQLTKRHMIGVSIVIHILLLLWLLGFTRAHHKNTALVPQALTPATAPDNDAWASTKARRSAPVVFMNMPSQPTQNTSASPSTSTTTSTTHSHVEESSQEEVTVQPSQETQSVVEQTPQPSTFFMQAARNALYKQMPRAYAAPISTQPTPASQPTQPTKPQPIQRTTQPVQPARQMPSMAHIAQGFTNYTHEEGEYTINVMGDPRKLPTEQQLKQHHYVEKLLHCLHASYATLKHKEPMVAHAMIQDPSVTMMVHRDGSMSDLRIVRSSGFPYLDTFYLALFTDASHSFPPLPSYFNHDSYRMNWVIMVK